VGGDLVELGKVAAEGEYGVRLQAETVGVSHRDDPEGSRLQQPIDPAAHRPLRQPRLLGQGDVALPGVVLQLSDDEAVDVVEAITHLLSLSGCGAANQPAPVASQRAEVLRIWR